MVWVVWEAWRAGVGEEAGPGKGCIELAGLRALLCCAREG